MAIISHPGKLVFIVGLLAAVVQIALSQGMYPHECDAEEVRHCYDNYVDLLWGRRDPDVRDNVGDEQIEKRCSALEAKQECHRRIAGCPEEVRRNFSRQERGYEALRDFFCDKNAARDYYTAVSCRDSERFHPCHVKHMEGVTPENTPDPTCKFSQINIECYETAFKTDCALPLKSAKAAISRGEKALMDLADCNGSARSILAPGQLLVAAAGLILARWASLASL